MTWTLATALVALGVALAALFVAVGAFGGALKALERNGDGQ